MKEISFESMEVAAKRWEQDSNFCELIIPIKPGAVCPMALAGFPFILHQIGGR
jgi:hypothetical protein